MSKNGYVLMADLKKNVVLRIGTGSNVGHRLMQDKKFGKKEKLKFGGFDNIVPKISDLELMEVANTYDWYVHDMKSNIDTITLTEYLLQI